MFCGVHRDSTKQETHDPNYERRDFHEKFTPFKVDAARLHPGFAIVQGDFVYSFGLAMAGLLGIVLDYDYIFIIFSRLPLSIEHTSYVATKPQKNNDNTP